MGAQPRGGGIGVLGSHLAICATEPKFLLSVVGPALKNICFGTKFPSRFHEDKMGTCYVNRSVGQGIFQKLRNSVNARLRGEAYGVWVTGLGKGARDRLCR